MTKIYHSPVIKTCEYCGNKFRVHVDRAETARFCSWVCKLKGYAKPEKTCLNCGKTFKARASKRTEDGRQIFCSKSCKWEYSKNTLLSVTCERCGKEFFVYPSRFKFGNPRFCSQECAGNIKRSKNERFTRLKTKTWSEIRQEVISRDGGVCKICGIDKQLTVHHITRWAETKNDSPNNLITLCRSCHYSVEWHGLPCPAP